MAARTGGIHSTKLVAAFGVACALAVTTLSTGIAQTGLDGFPTRTIAATPKTVEAGCLLYRERCSFCHGDEGMGDGPVAESLSPRSRDYTLGVFKFRTTNTGEPTTDEDIFRVITKGLPETAMPEWGVVLSEEQRW